MQESSSSADSSQAESRVDPPHAVHAPASKAAAGATVFKAALEIVAAKPVEQHAADLGERLQRRQEALERRSAELDSREQDLEAKIEAARLWFEEQNELMEQRTGAAEAPAPDERASRELAAARAALAQREKDLDHRQAELYQQIERFTTDRGRHGDRVAELDRRAQELERRESALSQREAAARSAHDSEARHEADAARRRAEIESQGQDVENQLAELARREAQLSARQAEIQLAIKRYEALGITERRVAEAEGQANESHSRALHLDEAEAMLAEEKRVLQREKSQLKADRQALQQQQLVERRKLEEEKSVFKQDLAHQRELLARREQRLDEREAVLGRLQVELEGTQREVLEMRLATEETWAQLTGVLAPASLTRSIAQVRSRLGEQYERVLRDMEQRRVELESVADQLAAEQERLEKHGRQLQEWSLRRDEEVEKQAARLVARERELDRQQSHYESLEARWNQERVELRARIRELLANLRQVDGAVTHARAA